MKTRVNTATNFIFSLSFCLGLASCNKEDFYEKEFLNNPFQAPTTTGSVDNGGQGGFDPGTVGGTQGGVNTGGDGGTAGSTTGSSSPTTGGSDGGSTTNGSTTGTSTGGTTGTVVHDPQEEIFHQSASETKKLDILWVIDNSGSMSDEQASLGSNFSAFIDDFILKDVDFKMAITTTDTSSTSKRGNMVQGSDTKLTSARAKNNESQFKADFKSLVKVGISGSGAEKGLDASWWFMNKYKDSFLRTDAYLAVVILSDEEDQSANAVVHYTDALKGIKSEAGLVKVYSIVDVGMTNVGQNGVTTGYQRYASASSQTAGITSDIRDSFHRSLSAMGDSIINLLDSFALAHDPVNGTLKVFVSGVETTSYSFDPASRSIKFDKAHLPSVGAEVRVTYLKQ